MASLQRATNETVALVPTAIMVVLGSLLATIITDVGRENVRDLDMEGGDALYPLATVFVLNAIMSGHTVRMVSIGMLSSSVTSLFEAWGVV